MGNFSSQVRKENNGCIRFILNKIFKTDFYKLMDAIKSGNLSLVKHYYHSKVNFSQYLPNGDTPLHWAVKNNQFQIMKFIVENVTNLNLNDKNFLGDSPLLLAVMNSNHQMVEYLIRKPVNLNIQENKGYTPFIAACSSGDLYLVKLLMECGSDYRLKARDGQTGLHRAAFYGNIPIVKYLIKELKMNVMVPDRKGNYPFHSASMKLNISCLRILIKASNLPPSDALHIPNKFGLKPIDILVKACNKLGNNEDPYPHLDAEQIEEYIQNKKNLPPFKISASPQSRRVSVFDLVRSRRSTIFQHGPNGLISPFLRLASNNDPSDKAIETQEADSSQKVIDERSNKQNDEEELLRPIKSPGSILKVSSDVPKLSFRAALSAIKDLSPLNSGKSVKFDTPRLMKKVRTVLKFSNQMKERRSFFKNTTLEKTTPVSKESKSMAGLLGSAKSTKFSILSPVSPSNRKPLSPSNRISFSPT